MVHSQWRETMNTPVYFRRGKTVGLTILDDDEMTVAFLTTYMNCENVTRYLMRRLPIGKNEEREWLQKTYKNPNMNIVFGITVIEDNELVGTIGLHHIEWIHRTASTGAWIATDKHRGKGIGCEAKLLLLDYAFNDLGLRKICSSVLATNERSRRYNEKCGYHVEATLKRQLFVYGEFVDELLMAVFKENFISLWNSYRSSNS